MESTKKLLWIFGSAEHLYSCRLFQELWFQKKNLKLDCSEFGALEINRSVDSTYSNYQSPPLCFLFVKVNQKVINVFYPSLKMTVKVVSVNMKSGTLKMIFLASSFDLIVVKHNLNK